jgi:NDP-sugar pyrophosphorylase family protein
MNATRNIQAIILCGGKGTRLSTLHPNTPKALAPVAGRPFLAWQIDWLKKNGIADIHLAAGHLSGQLSDWIASQDLPITISTEPRPLGTAGGLKYIEPFLRSNPFMVLNGDSLTPLLDFQALLEQHRRQKALATIAVAPIHDTGRYGTVEFDAGKNITAFREKAECSQGWINAGVYLLNRALLKHLPENTPLSIETDIFPQLAAQRQLQAFPAQPPLLDMGTPEGIAAMDYYLKRLQACD